MSMFKPQRAHKAKHGNYFDKPTQKEVKANLDFWSQLHQATGGFKNGEVNLTVGKPSSGVSKFKLGHQFKLPL